MTHAHERIAERLTAIGIADSDTHAKVYNLAAGIARKHRGDVAVKLLTVDHKVRSNDSSNSTGDTLVMVARRGQVTTVMLRGSSQPFTPKALRVDRTMTAAEALA
jgi:hypothetical protein